MEDDGAARRSARLDAALKSLENYISEVVTSNHGMKPDEMTRQVLENFNRSMQASSQYHGDMAAENNVLGNTSNMNYHNTMARIYNKLSRPLV